MENKHCLLMTLKLQQQKYLRVVFERNFYKSPSYGYGYEYHNDIT